MAVVVELLSKDGKVIQHYLLDKSSITIGRAYDNDIRIEDPYVCPHHLKVTENEETGSLDVVDNGSLNGIKINGKSVAQTLSSFDDIITLGRSRIRVFKQCQNVAPTVRLSALEEKIEWLDMRRVCAFFFSVFIAMIGSKYYLNSINQLEFAVIVKIVLTVAATASIWPLAFALLSKLAKKDTHIVSQFTLLWIFLIASELLDYGQTFLQFNSSAVQSIYWFILVTKGVLFFAFLWFALFFAFHQSNGLRNGIAAAGTILISVYTLSPHFVNTDKFHQNPKYNPTVLVPALRFAEASNSNDFVKRSSNLVNKLQKDKREDKD
ncbi:MAG: hypothetical protein Alis3KO_00400 [Aliiglaciecola sp.]|uniref:FHA domain-containing protein n=1 Tax=Aliiglaciecola sp. M165 TaxID=2593649 RepID=UPI00117CF430|nr:FHA domain-containing protein [Aliiglaciecola sp. M165]TRY32374.1 FHA domain-containing protein [Aliiglaciecola sp. M165]